MFRLRDCLFLALELGLADAGAAELDVEDALHGGEDLLVGDGGAALEVGDDRGRRVALGGQVLLRHLGLHLLPRLADDVAHLLAHRVRLDDVVAAVHLGEPLAFGTFADLIFASVAVDDLCCDCCTKV